MGHLSGSNTADNMLTHISREDTVTASVGLCLGKLSRHVTLVASLVFGLRSVILNKGDTSDAIVLTCRSDYLNGWTRMPDFECTVDLNWKSVLRARDSTVLA